MFTDFEAVWTPVLLQRHLRRRPVAVQIAGERLAVFRGADGRPGALQDRCPHRGVALSRGEVTAAGALACPFHGWQFAPDGACVHVPFNPQAKRDLLGVTAFPMAEAGGLIWLHTAPLGEAPPAPPAVPPTLADAGPGVFSLEVTWQTHWTRVMENMMDNAHLPFVHRRTLGRALRRALRPDSVLDVRCEGRPPGFFIEGRLDRTLEAGIHDFAPPNRVSIYLDGLSGALRVHIFCIPVTATATRLLIVGNFGRWNPVARLFLPLNRAIVQEDKAVVESARPQEVPPPGAEACVGTDRGTLMFRRYYYAHLKAPPASAPAPARVGLSRLR
jgi:phenylpropionate dioxygenase-like ring-hydroxylating dioxygenase large terminal subunit